MFYFLYDYVRKRKKYIKKMFLRNTVFLLYSVLAKIARASMELVLKHNCWNLLIIWVLGYIFTSCCIVLASQTGIWKYSKTILWGNHDVYLGFQMILKSQAHRRNLISHWLTWYDWVIIVPKFKFHDWYFYSGIEKQCPVEFLVGKVKLSTTRNVMNSSYYLMK